jgi:RNA polymerase sigma factor (sigma-70 family)
VAVADEAEVTDLSTKTDGMTGLTDLYRERGVAMVRLAHLLIGDNGAAQDLVHDAFIKVSERIESSRTGTAEPIDNPSAYLRRAVVNQCNSWHRHRAVEARHDRPGPEPIELGPVYDDLWVALASLPPKRRTAIVLRFYEDLSVDSVAQVMGVRPSTARSLIHRGLASLRKVVGHDE